MFNSYKSIISYWISAFILGAVALLAFVLNAWKW